MRFPEIARGIAAATLFTLIASSAAIAGQGAWQVSRVTGEVWIASAGAQKVSLTSASVVQAGDSIRTGRNGRVLLVRGEEVIMIAPGSEIAIPESSKDGMATTIVQRTGSATFEVEKRNVQHFQVETPYLAAVVKGTRFQVSVAGNSARVNVTRGAVDVSDFRSGQHALVMPGQVARVSAIGTRGLAISGPGAHSPILQGPPRAPSVMPESRAMRGAQSDSKVANGGRELRANGSPGGPRRGEVSRVVGHEAHKPGMRISAPIGDVKLDYAKVTKGLASAAETSAPGNRASNTTWNSSDSRSVPSMTNNNGQSASAAAIASGAGGGTAATASSGGSGSGNGNGNGSGNGNGNGNANANGVGSGNANANSNAGGNGNGNAYGLLGKTVDGVSNGVGKALGLLKK